MFLGEYAHALDAKGRLTIPVRFRTGLAAGMVITRGYDHCLFIYPQAQWGLLAAKAGQLPTSSSSARAYVRVFFGGAFELTPDRLGRVLIPSVLREYAGIDGEAVAVGANDRIELWNPARWQETLQHHMDTLDTPPDDVIRVGL